MTHPNTYCYLNSTRTETVCGIQCVHERTHIACSNLCRDFTDLYLLKFCLPKYLGSDPSLACATTTAWNSPPCLAFPPLHTSRQHSSPTSPTARFQFVLSNNTILVERIKGGDWRLSKMGAKEKHERGSAARPFLENGLDCTLISPHFWLKRMALGGPFTHSSVLSLLTTEAAFDQHDGSPYT